MYNPNPYGQPYGQPVYGYPPQGQPVYGQPVYGQPAYGYPQQGYVVEQAAYAVPGVAVPVQQVAYQPQPAYGVAAVQQAVPAYPPVAYPQQAYQQPYYSGVAYPQPAQQPVYPVGQSVFPTVITFQVRKNYVNEVGRGEMDIFLNGLAYYRLISNPAPSHMFGWGHNYFLYDLMNNQLAYIEQEVRLGMPHFNIFVRGQKYAKLKKEFTLLNKLFHLDTETGSEHIKIKGDWFSMSYKFERTDGKIAAQVMGNASNDMYDVTVQPGEDALMILLAVLTVEKLSRDSHH